MMEIVYGPVILACAWKSLAAGIVAGLLLPLLAGRLGVTLAPGLSRRIGLTMLAAGVFGLGHLTFVCAADGFPPRIIQSTAVMLAIVSLAGAALLVRRRNDAAQP